MFHAIKTIRKSEVCNMIAIYSPKHNNYFNNLADCIGKEFNFEFIFTINGKKKYEPVDIKFPSSNPVSESDLEFIEEKELKTS